jgi:hypothetical protein
MKKVVIPVFLILFLLNSGLHAEFKKIEPGEAIEDGQFGHQIKINKGELMVSGKRGRFSSATGFSAFSIILPVPAGRTKGLISRLLLAKAANPLRSRLSTSMTISLPYRALSMIRRTPVMSITGYSTSGATATLFSRANTLRFTRQAIMSLHTRRTLCSLTAWLF